VLPLPAKQSNTTAPGRDDAVMMCFSISSGFSQAENLAIIDVQRFMILNINE